MGRLIAAVLLLLTTSVAQMPSASSDVVRRLRVRVAFGDHVPCNSSTRVVLNGAMGSAIAESSVNGECTAEFLDVPPGRYRVSVQGSDATNADEGEIELNPVITRDLEVRAKHTRMPDATNWAQGAAFISVTDLRMPAKAAKEFEKANHLIASQDWQKASEHLHKGLAIYPKYAVGLNNLGAVYSHLGNTTGAREALQQAVAIDDRLAPAYVNLGRLSFLEKDYASAESLLTKAVTLEPTTNGNELFLLAYAQLSDHHPDAALETSRKGHDARLNQHAFLHLVAARAYEQEQKIPDSMAELRAYLSEEPGGPQADKVRTALATFQSQITTR